MKRSGDASAICLAMTLAVSFCARAEDRFEQCWRMPFYGRLVEKKSRAAVIALPVGSSGPTEDLDTPGYGWLGPDNSVYRFDFGTFSPPLPVHEFDQISLDGEVVGVLRWRDFGGVDRVIGQWHPLNSATTSFYVSIPVDLADCSSIARARAIVRSVKYINDIDRIRVRSVGGTGVHRFAEVENEIGDINRVEKGDPIASRGQVVRSIDSRGVMVGWYDYRKGRWVERRLLVHSTK